MTNTMLNRVRRALSPMGLSARVLISVVLAGAITSACDVHGITAPGTLASMTVSPNATLTVGATQQMTAVGYDADGRVVPVSPTWSVAAGGGTIAATGVFTAGSVPGLYAHTVVASVGSISANASITVIPGPLASIVVTPTPVTLAVTSTQQFIAVGKDAGGNIVAFTPSWSVVAGGGSVDQSGIFTAGATIGTYANTVQASSQGLKGFATVNVTVGPLASITVTPNPDTLIVGAKQQFTAVGKDVSGNTVVIAAVWSVAAGGGTVDGGGIFTAGATPGTFTNTIKATSGLLSATATVVVTAGPLATITVTPNPATMTINGTQQFTAVGSDIAGNPVAITAPVWAVAASGGTINATGLFTAGTVSGTFVNTVRATSGGLSGVATVIVTSGPLANITVTPNPVFMLTNSMQQFLAIGKDASGNVFVMKPVWSVVNGGGVIDTLGNFKSGVGLGTFNNTIQATSGAISGFATVNVGAGPLFSITVTPNPSNLNTGGTQTFTAVGKDALGNVMVITPAWSIDPLVGGGTINLNTGVFTAGAVAGAYNNTVRATSGAITGRATVNVTAPPVSPLGSAANFGILSGAAINCAISGSVTGVSSTANLGSGNLTINGFPLPCTFDGSIPLPGIVTTALTDLGIAYAAMQPAPGTCAGILPYPAGHNLSGLDLGVVAPPLPPGNYCFSSTAGLTGNLTLTGLATDKWTFTMESGLTTAVGSTVTLAGGAIPDNVYWVVGSSATLGSTSDFSGNILAQSAITLNNGATLHGRALARTAAVQMIAGAASIIKP